MTMAAVIAVYRSAAWSASFFRHRGQDGVLAPESGEGDDAGQGQAAEQEGPMRGRQSASAGRRSGGCRSTPPMACITLPAPRNNRALKKACVTRWNIPAVTPARLPAPNARNM